MIVFRVKIKHIQILIIQMLIHLIHIYLRKMTLDRCFLLLKMEMFKYNLMLLNKILNLIRKSYVEEVSLLDKLPFFTKQPGPHLLNVLVNALFYVYQVEPFEKCYKILYKKLFKAIKF